MNAEVKRVLLETAKLLSKPGCWTKGMYRGFKDGDPTKPCWCVTGALAYVAGVEVGAVEGRYGNSRGKTAHDALLALLGVVDIGGTAHSVFAWNDAQESVKPVVAALRKAARA